MTKDEIINMPAGMEMDALIAEKIFGFRLDYEFAEYYHERPFVKVLRDKYDENGVLYFYSTDIASAWEVAEKMGLGMLNNVHGRWQAYFPNNYYAEADTAPLAICRAALLTTL